MMGTGTVESAELDIRASEQRYRTTVESLLEGCQLIGFDWRYLYLNAAAAIHNRRPNGELLGRKLTEAWPGIEATAVFGMLKQCMDARIPVRGEAPFSFPDGYCGWFEVHCQPVPEGIIAMSVDISDRKRHEQELDRRNRLYAALSHVNQAIVRLSTRAELLQEICRVLVDHGGFAMAWIGEHDLRQRQIVPVAKWGDESDHVGDFRIYTDDRPESRGPGGTAFRECRPYICNRIEEDPITLPWRENYSRRGFRSSAGFPIVVRGQPWGMLGVYSSEPDFFQDGEVALLVEVANDTAFAIDTLDREAERIAIRELADRERNFSDTMIESLPGIAYFYTEAGQFLRWNHNFVAVSGYSPEEIAHMQPSDFFPVEEQARAARAIREVFAKGETVIEAEFRDKSGCLTPFFLTGRRVEFGGTLCLVGVGIDISDRRRAQLELEDYASRLQAASRELMVVQENERRALVRDLHDTVGQELTALGLNLTILRGVLPAGLPEPITQRLEDSQRLVEGTARHLREIMVELRPPGLDELGLFAALEEHTRQVARRTGLEVRIRGRELHERLPPTAEIALFRIVQEALNNAVKHAAASRVEVVLEEDFAGTHLAIRDNGKGFSSAKRSRAAGGMGMTTMRERAEAIGATIGIESASGRGTCVTVDLPAQPPPDAP